MILLYLSTIRNVGRDDLKLTALVRGIKYVTQFANLFCKSPLNFTKYYLKVTMNSYPKIQQTIMENDSDILEIYLAQAELLIPRLERVTPDSSWSHRAIGLRRSLLHMTQTPTPEIERLHAMVDYGFSILENAARDKVR